MAKFHSNKSNKRIETLGGRLISVQRAEHLIRELESAVETAHRYDDMDELHDIGINERALNHILDPADEEYVLTVELSHTDDADIAEDLLIEVLDRREDYGLLDAHINAPDIPAFFEQTTGIEGFHIEMPQSSA